MIRAALALALALLPVAAEACASCISSAFGDRRFGWAYLVLFTIPFALATVIGAVFVRVSGVGLSDLRRWLAGVLHPAGREEETT